MRCATATAAAPPHRPPPPPMAPVPVQVAPQAGRLAHRLRCMRTAPRPKWTWRGKWSCPPWPGDCCRPISPIAKPVRNSLSLSLCASLSVCPLYAASVCLFVLECADTYVPPLHTLCLCMCACSLGVCVPYRPDASRDGCACACGQACTGGYRRRVGPRLLRADTKLRHGTHTLYSMHCARVRVQVYTYICV
jgi:hypothetical protein